jgi:predicted neuraminidase
MKWRPFTNDSTQLKLFAIGLSLGLAIVSLATGQAAADEKPAYRESFVFPQHPKHNHAPGIVECPNGDILVSWYRGSGEKSADDVAVYGARQRKGTNTWSDAFLMVDTPGFPDGNTAMMIDKHKRLWLFWPLILANSWESCLTEYAVSSDYEKEGAPKWDWQAPIPLAPLRFEEKMTKTLDELEANIKEPNLKLQAIAATFRGRLKQKMYERLGWQTRCKPTVLPSGRILLPLYTDTYSVSLMAISDDEGKTWRASEPICGFGNIQPTVLRRNDGTLVAYMRENGPVNKIRVSESKDDGVTWGPVGQIDLPNPGAGIDGVRLANGHWALVYNDQVEGRNSLAVSISEDEGKTWPITRHLEKQERGSYHYPAVIQGADGTLHFVYSYFVKDEKGKDAGKTMKHVACNEAWVREGDK